jgi:Fic-DOC domain mobile mystery protein B
MKKFKTSEGQTPFDASGLIPANIRNYKDLNAAEIRNIVGAARKHLKRRKNAERVWLTEKFIRTLHRDMFCNVWGWAGNYRDSEFNIGVKPYLIREEIAKVCQDMAAWDKDTTHPMPVLERAVRLHHRLGWIHPFPNGNGRLARLLLEIYLHAHDHPRPMWPDDEGKTRQEYLAALRHADHGDFAPLIECVRRFLPK